MVFANISALVQRRQTIHIFLASAVNLFCNNNKRQDLFLPRTSGDKTSGTKPLVENKLRMKRYVF